MPKFTDMFPFCCCCCGLLELFTFRVKAPKKQHFIDIIVVPANKFYKKWKTVWNSFVLFCFFSVACAILNWFRRQIIIISSGYLVIQQIIQCLVNVDALCCLIMSKIECSDVVVSIWRIYFMLHAEKSNRFPCVQC